MIIRFLLVLNLFSSFVLAMEDPNWDQKYLFHSRLAFNKLKELMKKPAHQEEVLNFLVWLQENMTSQKRRKLVSRVDQYGNTLLHTVVQKSTYLVLQQLLNMGASGTSKNTVGWTPLNFTLFFKKPYHLGVLLAYMKDPQIDEHLFYVLATGENYGAIFSLKYNKKIKKYLSNYNGPDLVLSTFNKCENDECVYDYFMNELRIATIFFPHESLEDPSWFDMIPDEVTWVILSDLTFYDLLKNIRLVSKPMYNLSMQRFASRPRISGGNLNDFSRLLKTVIFFNGEYASKSIKKR